MTLTGLVLLICNVAGVVGIWMIAGLLQKGLYEHVRALQAIYELLEKRQQRP
jgi:hypothetical protein